MSYYVDNYVNNTQTFQINDARQLPIIIPSSSDLKALKTVFADAIDIKMTTNDPQSLFKIQVILDTIVNRIYSVY